LNLSPLPRTRPTNDPNRFVLKTKEQRAAEKALLDKSPLKTLTLEEFLESERHKLTGKLTPVTPETFAEWKKQRISKKLAEEQARKAKEATGRMLFESGNWRTEESDVESDDEADEAEAKENAWNLEKLRKETEALRAKEEQERLAKENSASATNGETSQDTAPPEEATEATEAEASTAT
jgi:hypothetical protein